MTDELPSRESMERLMRALWWKWPVVVETKGFLPTANGRVDEIEAKRTDDGFVGHIKVGTYSVPLKYIVSVRFETTEAIG